MKNKEEEPKEYFERSILLVVTVTISGLIIDWFSIKMLLDVNPWGSATAIPGLIITLQALWLIVNPYAIVYEDRFEIKQSLLYNKQFYYLDAKSINSKSSMSVQLVYNDGDLDRLPLLGMRASHKEKFKARLAEKINESLKNRSF
ncbi:MAG: hypothetical protein C0448_08565 [Sphingobacteriaceae bacterium]|nr:hypothetical protein [Sphingobacteriaceae bacterium]